MLLEERYLKRISLNLGCLIFRTNFRNNLRNRIHLGTQMETSKGSMPSSSNPARSTIQVFQSHPNNSNFTFRSDSTPMSIGLVSSTMHSHPNHGNHHNWDLGYEISAPLSAHHNTMVREKEDQSVRATKYSIIL